MKTQARLWAGVLILVLLPSCFTAAVWNAKVRDHDGDGTPSFEQRDGEDWTESFWAKILATPFTIILDVCTYPIQAAIMGWDDDDQEEVADDC